MSDELELPDYGTLGVRVLSERLDVLNKRAEGRLMTHVEIAEKRGCEKGLAELAAVLKARARIPAGKFAPLDVVRLQMEELDKADLSYDCLNTDDIAAIRSEDDRARD